MIATARPARFAASRTRSATSAWSSALPWEKLSRATSIPAATIFTRTSGSREAGPMVATILVRRMARLYHAEAGPPWLSGASASRSW